MKLIALLVILFSGFAHAGLREDISIRDCGGNDLLGIPGVPDHFITTEHYFGTLVREAIPQGGYPPHVMAKSKGLIVVTEALRKYLSSAQREQGGIIAVNLVVSSHALDTDNLLKKIRNYDFEAEVADAHFGTGWVSVRAAGRGSSVARLLSTSFAKNHVMWAGMGSPKDFVRRASEWFTQAQKIRNESW